MYIFVKYLFWPHVGTSSQPITPDLLHQIVQM